MKKTLALILALVLVLGASSALAVGTADKPVTLRVQTSSDLTEEKYVMFFAELTKLMAANGDYINFELLGKLSGTYGTVLPIALMSGEVQADMMYFQGGDEIVVANDLLEDLTEWFANSTYVKSHMENYSAQRVDNYPYIIYSQYPQITLPVIRGDYAAQLETFPALIEDPTVDNYYALFQELKASGLCKYPLTWDNGTTSSNVEQLDDWVHMFKQAFGVTGTLMQAEDGTWVYGVTTQEYKNLLEFFAKLYAEDMIDPEYITDAYNAMEDKFYNGSVAMVSATVGATTNVYNNKMVIAHGEEAGLISLPPAKGIGSGLAVNVTKNPRGWAISSEATEEAKEAAWAVFEFICSPRGRTLDLLGAEGWSYEIENGMIMLNDNFNAWTSRFFEGIGNYDPEYPPSRPRYGENALYSLELVNENFIPDTNVVLPDDYITNWDAMNTLFKEYANDIIRGVRPLSAFDEFVAKWNAAGGTEISAYLATVME